MADTQADMGLARPRVFLSSVYREWADGELVPLSLRQMVIESAADLPVELDAIAEPVPLGESSPIETADDVMDRCFASVRACDLFVLILSRRSGSGVLYVPEGTGATYTEMEVFAACIWGKPILVLHETGLDDPGALEDVLALLRGQAGGEDYVVGAAPELLSAFRNECGRLVTGRNRQGSRFTLPEGLSRLRTDRSAARDLSAPHLLFLRGRLGPVAGNPNPDRAARLIDQVQTGRMRTAGGTVAMSHGAAMFRLWASMRDLMGGTSTPWEDPDYANLWDQALGLWAARGSWLGLHGHIWLGPLAALNLQLAVRAQSVAAFGEDVREPHGARASSIYSIAGNMRSRERKLYFYNQALLATDEALRFDPDATGGVLSIRGHILMRRAQMGQFTEIFGAVAAFRQSLKQRQKSEAPEASIGEAQVDLGFAYVLALQPWLGLPLIHEGIALMRKDRSPTGLSFLVRGLRKLEQAAKLTGNLRLARATRIEGLAISEKVEAFDQWRRL